MNAPLASAVASRPRLSGLAFAALAPEGLVADGSIEATWLSEWRELVGVTPAEAWTVWSRMPPREDAYLHALATRHLLTRAEVLAVALASAAELDPMAARVLVWLQAPAGQARPTAGLVACMAAAMEMGGAADATVEHLTALHSGAARSIGLLQFDDERALLAESAMRVPPPIVLALTGHAAAWPGVQLQMPDATALSASVKQGAQCHARAFAQGTRVLALRCAAPREGLACAQEVAQSLGRRAVLLPWEVPAGVGIWLQLTRHIPVFRIELAPGEAREIAALPGYEGPILVVTNLDGALGFSQLPVVHWRIPLPPVAERVSLWQQATGDAGLAEQLGRQHRLSASRIKELAQAGYHEAKLAGAERTSIDSIATAARGGAAIDLGSLAQLLPERIPDAALVLPAALRATMEQLAVRCRARDALADPLGVALRTRYRPGVRALLVGPSGTGKTLAAGWLATKLGLPLYRVDLASVTSKYIGETEKNLAQLFARAEHAEVMLLFDEADALFGKRTDVKDATDRFANNQTNYMLQRIECFDGIAVLTSNSRARFDSAFSRRLDSIIDFPAPNPEERRALWLAHLGNHHALSASQINQVAAICELAGGHIRNATLAAAAANPGPIEFAVLCSALAGEYRKLGRQLPAGL